jgi:hypothetical protein
MPVRVGTAVFHDWKAIEYPPAGWTDTFIFNLDPRAGLPPDDYVDAIRKLITPLNKLRPGASLWIKVSGPGMWYAREVQRVIRHGAGMAVAVTKADVETPWLESFSYIPYTIKVPSPPPLPTDKWGLGDLAEDSIACLRILARLDKGYTNEIASLTRKGLDSTRKILRELVDEGYAERITDFAQSAKPIQATWIGGKEISRKNAGVKKSYPFWKITRRGISIAHRSWGLPPDYHFPERKEHRTPMDSRHRRTLRQWPAWLRKAWPHADIWCGWSEVHIEGLEATPDALAWGALDGNEALFWCEVESGHSAGVLIRKKISRRLAMATAYAESLKVRLVFVLLAMPWVQEAARPALAGINSTTAVITSDWRRFGQLPVVEWGRVRMDVES